MGRFSWIIRYVQYNPKGSYKNRWEDQIRECNVMMKLERKEK
jgi:hypothetical protein